MSEYAQETPEGPMGLNAYVEQSCVVYVENGTEEFRIAIEEVFVDIHREWYEEKGGDDTKYRGTLRSASYTDNPNFTILFGVPTYWPQFMFKVVQGIDGLDRKELAPEAEIRIETGEQWVYPPIPVEL